jgi:hypothetical protein
MARKYIEFLSAEKNIPCVLKITFSAAAARKQTAGSNWQDERWLLLRNRGRKGSGRKRSDWLQVDSGSNGPVQYV